MNKSFLTIVFPWKLVIPKKGDLPQRAQRKFEIKQEDKLLFSALLCALVK
jgi:hypothetical protein